VIFYIVLECIQSIIEDEGVEICNGLYIHEYPWKKNYTVAKIISKNLGSDIETDIKILLKLELFLILFLALSSKLNWSISSLPFSLSNNICFSSSISFS